MTTTEREAPTTRSAERAYQRRQRRTQRITQSRLDRAGRPVRSAMSRAPLVVAVIAILGGGLAGVLYLNTMSDQVGMEISASHQTQDDLRLQLEGLQREVADLDATPRIAAEAKQLGLVPAGDAAILQIDRAGKVSLIGTPTAVPGPPAPPAPTPKPSTTAAAPKPSTTAAAPKPSTAAAAPKPTTAASAPKPSTTAAAPKPSTAAAAPKPSTAAGTQKPAQSTSAGHR